MSQEELLIGKSLFGYRTEKIDRYINDVNKSNDEKLKEIKNKIIHLKMENTRIKKEIEELKNLAEEKVKSEDLMGFALEKAEELIPVINKLIDRQVFEVSEIYRQQEAAFDRKIEEFNNTIKNTQAQLNSLLKAVIHNSESLGENVKSVIEKKDSYKHMLNKINKTGNEVIINGFQADKAVNESIVGEKGIVDEGAFFEEQLASNDINHIRYKYLLGKIAGEDLFDKNNKIIIAKNSVINVEAIEKAEEEGKLAELIVNMILPDVKI